MADKLPEYGMVAYHLNLHGTPQSWAADGAGATSNIISLVSLNAAIECFLRLHLHEGISHRSAVCAARGRIQFLWV